MKYYNKSLNQIVFDVKDLMLLFEKERTVDLFKELQNREGGGEKLKTNDEFRKDIVDAIVKKRSKKKEDIELFIAIDFVVHFFKSDGKIGFHLKRGINPTKEINTIDDLKNIIEEDSVTDFNVWTGEGVRQIQLKQYRRALETLDLVAFIEEKVAAYGDRLGDVNLFVLLQGDQSDSGIRIMNIDFSEIYNALKRKSYKFNGQILLAYSSEDREYIVNQVFPALTTSSRSRLEIGWDII